MLTQAEIVAKLQAASRLEKGWDSYKADPPSQLAIANAGIFLGLCGDFLPDRVAPSVMGGIGVTFRRPGKKVYVEFYNYGTTYSLRCHGDDIRAEEVADYQTFLTAIRSDLGANGMDGGDKVV